MIVILLMYVCVWYTAGLSHKRNKFDKKHKSFYTSMGLVRDRKGNWNLQMFSNNLAVTKFDLYWWVDDKY